MSLNSAVLGSREPTLFYWLGNLLMRENNLQKRVLRLGKAVNMGEPTSEARCEHASDGRWWLLGFAGGDQPLPRTLGCHTLAEALDAAEGWLAPELSEYLLRRGSR